MEKVSDKMPPILSDYAPGNDEEINEPGTKGNHDERHQQPERLNGNGPGGGVPQANRKQRGGTDNPSHPQSQPGGNPPTRRGEDNPLRKQDKSSSKQTGPENGGQMRQKVTPRPDSRGQPKGPGRDRHPKSTAHTSMAMRKRRRMGEETG